jgi:3-hydroxyisobutyrate dehydrogenase-like beta-hydroxyacid dehydrogenase
MKLAICGLGVMGQAFADRALDVGHEVTMWNRSSGKAGDLLARGAREAESPADAAAGADVVLVVVTDDAAALQVCLGEPVGEGEDGGAGEGDRDPARAVVSGMSDRTLLANASTVSPATARRIAEQGPDGRVFDTPILGAPTAVRQGKGRFLVGGPDDRYADLRPLLESLCAEAVHCGPTASGATMKLACNLLLISGVTALAEAVEIARGQGLDDAQITTALDGSLVMSPAMTLRLPALLDPDHPGWFGPVLARKDVRLASELAEQAGLDARIAPATAALLDKVADGGWPDFAAVIEAVRNSLSE